MLSTPTPLCFSLQRSVRPVSFVQLYHVSLPRRPVPLPLFILLNWSSRIVVVIEHLVYILESFTLYLLNLLHFPRDIIPFSPLVLELMGINCQSLAIFCLLFNLLSPILLAQ